jgi:hypothetical protein
MTPGTLAASEPASIHERRVRAAFVNQNTCGET